MNRLWHHQKGFITLQTLILVVAILFFGAYFLSVQTVAYQHGATRAIVNLNKY